MNITPKDQPRISFVPIIMNAFIGANNDATLRKFKAMLGGDIIKKLIDKMKKILLRHFTRSTIHKVFLTLIISSLTGCGISAAIKETNTKIESAINSFDRAIAALAQESADWRVVMYDLEKDISEDVQSTIRTEIDNLTRSAILTAGSEIRCNSDFIRLRLERELIRIRNSFAKEINIQLAKIPGYGDRVPLIPEMPTEPVICSAVPSGVDLNLDPKRRQKIDIFGFDLRSRNINVYVINYGNLTIKEKFGFSKFVDIIKTARKLPSEEEVVSNYFVLDKPSRRQKNDITKAFSIISNYHAVLDLTEAGVNIGPNAQEIVLTWNDQIRSEIPILARQQFLKCEVISTAIDPGSKTFTPPSVKNNTCGTPDNDFDDHGPCVRFTLSLNLDAERKILKASYWMNAWECPDDFGLYKKDCTEAVGSDAFVLFGAEENEKIISYDVQSSLNYEYIDNTHEQDIRNFAGNEPITELTFVGDTDGDEAGTRTRVKMTFRRINLKIEKCELE